MKLLRMVDRWQEMLDNVLRVLTSTWVQSDCSTNFRHQIAYAGGWSKLGEE